jgi:hypothetical protein
VRESVTGGKNIFCLMAAARAAPRPQDHARCVRWGLRRVFCFAVLFSPVYRTQAPQPSLHAESERERERESVAGGKQYFCLAAAARVAPRPQGHARCVRWGLRRGLFLRSFLVQATGPQRHTPAYRGVERGRTNFRSVVATVFGAATGKFICN